MRRNPTAKIASPRDRNQIRKDVYNLRRQLRIPPKTRVDILGILEFALPIVDPDFHLVAVSDRELPGRYAETKPAEHAIYVKQSVYDAATRDGEWARMILAHELGHYYCHDVTNISYACLDANARIDPDIDPERQADIFAAELLAPSGELKGLTPREVQKNYGVSPLAARNQLRQAANLQRRQRAKKEKAVRQKSNR